MPFSSTASATGPAGGDEMYYLWVVLYSAYFLGRVATAVHVTLLAVAYAATLAAIDPGPIAVSRWLSTVGLVVGSGVVVTLLKERVAQKEEFERANRAKSEFLSRVSHELRTPLNAILGFAQLLEMEKLAPGQRESVQHIVKGGRHLLTLIDEVLEISRIEAGAMTISPEAVHVGSVLSDLIDLVRPLAAERDIRLEPPPAAADRYVGADNQRLRQVMLNLLSNAIKYNHEGGSVTVSLDQATVDCLRILVSDTGPGIAKEKLVRLFRPFERLGAEQSSVQGTGLGLALTKLLVEAMGGSLSVDTKLGAGTTFAVELALAAEPGRQAKAALRGDYASTNGAGARRTLLYVEDNPSNLELVERILTRRPEVRMISAPEGELGVELARRHRPDLVLLDLNLTGISGEEVLERLKEDPRTQEIPVVVVSADATEGRIARMLAAESRAYLTKPLDVRRFLEVVDEALHERTGSRS